ncbi:heme ABC transporter ATP-binding protein CcmA [Solemya pervernicosa gill symbiont]|uniref:Heme ABC transporter ATP-binding protein CcmA n=2 Tax=Gammaproteobacteria incertae sedis TaxID=118884 RepID=A0A1T2L1V7_9GAMM|nr:cytochrome c biogenesis heme-transporting ATPase CcmA [Candidatus Reidiella endopervernicosa]OOZ39044.1 heme ABC transporter ATP-binding protein CcmA [Solemya pervernicosa gill symbiont]QKQ27680.1 cytochrome c biogenesis heme-transporting ATPase CcmA [Candidatus Reidiella endopervernicosa]
MTPTAETRDSEPLFEAHALECTRDDRVLFSDLDFTLKSGQAMLIEGPNGSGKTTLLRTLCGLISPSNGEIHWCGESIRSLAEEYTREVTYIGHHAGIKEDLTGIENLRISCVLDGFEISEKQAWDTLEKMGLAGHEDLPTKVLSAGQKRRVALARLLVTEAKLWILDEPFTALDKAAVAFLLDVIRKHVDGGGIVMLTTHQDVEMISDDVKRLLLKKRGRN